MQAYFDERLYNNVLIAISIISLSVLISCKKSGFTYIEDLSEDYSDSADTSRESNKNEHQFDFTGQFRKSFALQVFLSDDVQNVVCSPVSALIPLAKLAIGAEGSSERELLSVIGISRKSKIKHKFRKMLNQLKRLPGVDLDVASRIFVSNKAKLYKKFTDDADKIFKSSVKALNFDNTKETEQAINDWIAKESRKLKKVQLQYKVSGVQSSVIINIVTFNGDWEQKFHKVSYKEFDSPNGGVTVPMMFREGYYNYSKSDALRAEVLEIPFEKEKASFVIVLPFSKIGLKVLLRQLKLVPDLLNAAMDKMQEEKIILSIPKFKIQSKQNLKPIYRLVGLHHVLSDHSGLTRIIEGQQLAISEAWQFTMIDVNEEGTQGAAATAVELTHISKDLNEVIFNANRPFLFYVKSAKEQLFAGTYAGF